MSVPPTGLRRVRDGVRRRALVATDMTPLLRAERRVASLEAAVAENAALAVPLEERVTELERTLADVMQRAEARRMGS